MNIEFHDGNPLTGDKGTPIAAAWLNALLAVGALFHGTANPPDPSLGDDGDHYLNTPALLLFGPKTGGSWGTGVSLKGDAGATLTVDYGYELPDPPTTDLFFVLVPADTTPVAFSFTPVAGVELSTVTISGAVTITGISGPSPVAVSGGEWAKSSDGSVWSDFTSAAGTVLNNYQVKVRGTSDSKYFSPATVTLTVGSVTGNFIVTTKSVSEIFTGTNGDAPNGAVWSHLSGISGSGVLSSGSYSQIQSNQLKMHLSSDVSDGTSFAGKAEVLSHPVVRANSQSVSVDLVAMNTTAGNMRVILTPTLPSAYPLNSIAEEIQLIANGTSLLVRQNHGGTLNTTFYNAAAFTNGSTHNLKLVHVDATHIGIYVDNVQVSGSPFAHSVDLSTYYVSLQGAAFGGGFVDQIFDNLVIA